MFFNKTGEILGRKSKILSQHVQGDGLGKISFQIISDLKDSTVRGGRLLKIFLKIFNEKMGEIKKHIGHPGSGRFGSHIVKVGKVADFFNQLADDPFFCAGGQVDPQYRVIKAGKLIIAATEYKIKIHADNT